MAIVKPFRGLRPPKSIVKQLASRPYDVLNSEEARQEAAGNPYSLLRVTKAEIDLPKGTDEHSQQVYDKVVENFNLFKKEGYLVKDTEERGSIKRMIDVEALYPPTAKITLRPVIEIGDQTFFIGFYKTGIECQD